MERSVQRNNTDIRHKIDSNKPFICSINDIKYKLLLKSKKHKKYGSPGNSK